MKFQSIILATLAIAVGFVAASPTPDEGVSVRRTRNLNRRSGSFEGQVQARAVSAMMEPVEDVAAKIASLGAGQSVVIGSLQGLDITLIKDEDGSLTVDDGGIFTSARSSLACTWAVAAAIYALGAAAIGALALTGGATIGGVFISAALLRALGAYMSSWSAIYGFVAANIC